MKLHEKYLKTERIDEASKKEAMDKVIKVIRSVRDEKQMMMAKRMVHNFLKMYGDTFWAELTSLTDSFPQLAPLWRKFEKEMDNKSERLRFTKANNIDGDMSDLHNRG
jgi:hypothetical protein